MKGILITIIKFSVNYNGLLNECSLSNLLLEKETLDLRQITHILGKRPFPPKSNFKAYLEIQEEDDEELK